MATLNTNEKPRNYETLGMVAGLTAFLIVGFMLSILSVTALTSFVSQGVSAVVTLAASMASFLAVFDRFYKLDAKR